MGYQWRAPDNPQLGFMNRVSGLFRAGELARENALPNIRAGSTLLIGSDYSGQHKTSAYEAMSFLIADWSTSTRWNTAQAVIRGALMPDDRRFGFKHMNDRIRLAALPRFLSAADTISGLLLVVLIHKSVGRLFVPSVDVSLLDEQLRLLARWPRSTLERALCACHFVALLLAGLSRQGQHAVWITDADDIVANETRQRQFCALFTAVSAPYLEHDLGHFRLGTTASDSGKRDLEDFVAIPDLAAGAVCDTLNTFGSDQVKLPKGVIAPIPEKLRRTTRQLMVWWANRASPLKRLALCVEPGSSPENLLLRHVDFMTAALP